MAYNPQIWDRWTTIIGYRRLTVMPCMSKFKKKRIRFNVKEFTWRQKFIKFWYQSLDLTEPLEIHTTKYLKFCIKISLDRVFIDLSKAFDAVNHEVLAQKTSAHYVYAAPVYLLGSQTGFKNRKQFDLYNGNCLGTDDVWCNLVQGSVL